MNSICMVLEEYSKPLIKHEVEIPRLDQGEILVKMEVAGICGSDLHIKLGHDYRTPLPIILGHEGVGYVLDICGSAYSFSGEKLELGDRITWDRGLSCGVCVNCKSGLSYLCNNRETYGITLPFNSRPFLTGTFSEYVILKKGMSIFKLNNEISSEIAVSCACSGSTAAHAVEKADISKKDKVIIQGSGPLGIFATIFALDKGSDVIIIENSDNRTQFCKKLGVKTINQSLFNDKDLIEYVLAYTEGGANVIIEASGNSIAPTIGLSMLAKNGKYVSVGMSQPSGLTHIDFFEQVVKKSTTIKGVWVSSEQHIIQALDLVKRRKSSFDGFISNRYKLEEINEAFEFIKNKSSIKTILTF